MTSPAKVVTNTIALGIAELVLDPTNARQAYDDAALKGLAASIKAVGIIQPLVVRPGKPPEETAGRYIVVAGHRRLKAAKLAGLTHVPVVVREVDVTGAHLAQFAENHEREGLTPLEEAQHLARHLETTRQTQEQLAQGLGVAPSVISDAVTLAHLPAAVQQLFTGPAPLSAAHARELARLKAYPEALADRLDELKNARKFGEVPSSKQLRQQVDWDLQDVAARDKAKKARVAEAKKAAAEKDKAKNDAKARARAAAEREKAKRQAEAERRAAEREEKVHDAIHALLDERTPRYVEAVLAVREKLKLPDPLLERVAELIEKGFGLASGSDYIEDIGCRVRPKLPGAVKRSLPLKDAKACLSIVALEAWFLGLGKAFDDELEVAAKKKVAAAPEIPPPAKKGGRK